MITNQTRFQGIETEYTINCSSSLIITNQTRFQGIETSNDNIVFAPYTRITNQTRFQGIETR